MIALLLIAGKVSAQFSAVWNYTYQHTFTPGYSNEGRKVAEDAGGNIFALSDVTSDIDPSGVQGTSTYHYVNITKYSTNGVALDSLNIEVYNHLSNGYDNPGGFGLDIDAVGNVYVGYTTYDPVNGFDVALGKYDNNLSRIWTNLYSTIGDDAGMDFKLNASGTIYAVIKSSGIQTVYSIVESVPMSTPPLVVYSYPANSVGINSLAFDGLQTLYVGGYAAKGGYKNAYVAAIDISSNSILWGSAYTPKGVIGDDVVNEITVGIDGNIYAAGTSYQGPLFGDQAFILKNQPGNPRFDFVALLKGGFGNTKGLLINATESGWVYAGAVCDGDNSAYVFRIPDNGNFTTAGSIKFSPLPGDIYNTINSISLRSMKVSSSKNIYITGGVEATGPSGIYSSSYLHKASVVFGNALINAGTMPVNGQYTKNYEGIGLTLDYSKTDVYWLRNNWDNGHNSEKVEVIDVSVTSPLRKEFTAPAQDWLSLSPSPATDFLTVQSDQLIKSIEVLDIAGNRVLFAEMNSNAKMLDVSSLARGVYICKANTETGELIKKIIIN